MPNDKKAIRIVCYFICTETPDKFSTLGVEGKSVGIREKPIGACGQQIPLRRKGCNRPISIDTTNISQMPPGTSGSALNNHRPIRKATSQRRSVYRRNRCHIPRLCVKHNLEPERILAATLVIRTVVSVAAAEVAVSSSVSISFIETPPRFPAPRGTMATPDFPPGLSTPIRKYPKKATAAPHKRFQTPLPKCSRRFYNKPLPP